MTVHGKEAAALALHRFGFGPAPDSIAAIAADPRGALLAELERVDSHRIGAELPGSAAAARDLFEFRAQQQAKQKLAARLQKDAGAPNGTPSNVAVVVRPAVGTDAPAGADKEPPLPQRLLQDEAMARFDAAAGAPIGLTERLVWFWSNHFCISADKAVAMAGAYEREAIRPHVLGRFGDMLAAVESHPAMLVYLDNIESMGADSIAGINRDKGLNENLAREILELHTLGVRSGYTQEDVTHFANVLTGWTWIVPAVPRYGGEFVFVDRLHQPGEQTVLGKTYDDPGVGQGRAVLADLAHHPATARHIATKLARHFVTDEPPPSLVARLEKTFNDSGGNLKEVTRALLTADESWTPQRSKLKPPAEWIAGMLRLTNTRLQAAPGPDHLDPMSPAGASWPVGRALGVLSNLGEPLWRPPAPNGYPDIEAAWIDGVPQRLDVANEIANRLPPATDPLALLEASIGPLASADTRRTVERAESRRQAVTLLLMAPEFLRR